MLHVVRMRAIAYNFRRSPYIPMSRKGWHSWWCRHILDLEIQRKRKPVLKYMPARSQDIGPSPNTISKNDWIAGIILFIGVARTFRLGRGNFSAKFEVKIFFFQSKFRVVRFNYKKRTYVFFVVKV